MKIQIHIMIHRPVEAVFPVVSDLTMLPRYDRSIVEVKQISPSPLGVGADFQVVTRQLGLKMVAMLEITAYEPASYRFAYRVSSGPFPVVSRFTLEHIEPGTRLTAEREPQPGGFWKWVTPLLTTPARKKLEIEINALKNFLEISQKAPAG